MKTLVTLAIVALLSAGCGIVLPAALLLDAGAAGVSTYQNWKARGAAEAQTDEIKALREEIRKLRSRIEELESRIKTFSRSN